MRISLSDAGEPGLSGAWYNPDPIELRQMIAGSPVTFLEDSTSSADAEDLYDLSAPPSFSGPVMVWGRVAEDGALELFLAEAAGDDSFPFARLADYRSALDGSGGLTGTGDLYRAHQMGGAVNWSVEP